MLGAFKGQLQASVFSELCNHGNLPLSPLEHIVRELKQQQYGGKEVAESPFSMFTSTTGSNYESDNFIPIPAVETQTERHCFTDFYAVS